MSHRVQEINITLGTIKEENYLGDLEIDEKIIL
jgi:hypothetical protein